MAGSGDKGIVMDELSASDLRDMSAAQLASRVKEFTERMKQMKRLAVYYDFEQRPEAVLYNRGYKM